MEIRHAFDVPESLTVPEGETMTEESHKEQCDINNILKRFTREEIEQHALNYAPQYGDVTGVDYESALNLVAECKSEFEHLPAETRAYFENDVKNYLEFVGNPANDQEAREMGLLYPGPERPTGVAAGEVPAPGPGPAESPAEAPTGAQAGQEQPPQGG